MGKIADTLREAKALIDTPEKWCQHVYAKLPSGVSTSGEDQHACQFCSLGALRRVNPRVPAMLNSIGVIWELPRSLFESELFLLKAVQREPGYEMGEVADFNDSKPHSEVMRVWDNAISLAEKEELAQC